ncbi:MAG: Lrp/AsnC family transcriptional regulator, partial [Anaerorhabdus sp.]|uniref:Lrp/AsnC family transcriptional regulator n=1 Tax=Anaerorhabdus sp. TaxID=1872524 RepID=UPI003A88A8B9
MYSDEMNLAIIRHLQDGRVPFKKSADERAVSAGTVRSRVRMLTDEGVLDMAGLVDPEVIPDLGVVMVGVKVKDMDLVKKGEEFSRLKGVTSVCVVTGRYDLILTVLLTKEFTMLRFYTEEVSTIDRVQSVESFVV